MRDSRASPNSVPRPGRFFAGSSPRRPLPDAGEAGEAWAWGGSPPPAGAADDSSSRLSLGGADRGGAARERGGSYAGGVGARRIATGARSGKNATPITPTSRACPSLPAYESATEEKRNVATSSTDVRNPSMVASPYAGRM